MVNEAESAFNSRVIAGDTKVTISWRPPATADVTTEGGRCSDFETPLVVKDEGEGQLWLGKWRYYAKLARGRPPLCKTKLPLG